MKARSYPQCAAGLTRSHARRCALTTEAEDKRAATRLTRHYVPYETLATIIKRQPKVFAWRKAS